MRKLRHIVLMLLILTSCWRIVDEVKVKEEALSENFSWSLQENFDPFIWFTPEEAIVFAQENAVSFRISKIDWKEETLFDSVILCRINAEIEDNIIVNTYHEWWDNCKDKHRLTPTLTTMFKSWISKEKVIENWKQMQYRKLFLELPTWDKKRLELIDKFNWKNSFIIFEQKYESINEEEKDKMIWVMYLSKDPSIAYSGLVSQKITDKKQRNLLISNLNTIFWNQLIENEVIIDEQEIEKIQDIIKN